MTNERGVLTTRVAYLASTTTVTSCSHYVCRAGSNTSASDDTSAALDRVWNDADAAEVFRQRTISKKQP